MKTLKDIELQVCRREETKDGLSEECFCEEDLKKEICGAAREWIDFIENWERGDRKYTDLKGLDRLIDYHYYHRDLLIEGIKMFFNLEDK